MKTALIKNNLIFLSIIFVISFISCKKEEKVPTATEKITSYNWLITAAKMDPPIQIDLITKIGDIFIMEPCFQDDKIKFNSDGTYSVNKEQACNTSDINYTGTWAFKENEAKLYMTNYGNTGNAVSFSIIELSTTIMNLSMPIVTSGDLYTAFKAYGLDGYLAKSIQSATPVSIAPDTKFLLTLRAL